MIKIKKFTTKETRNGILHQLINTGIVETLNGDQASIIRLTEKLADYVDNGVTENE